MPEYVVRASFRSHLEPSLQEFVNVYHFVDAQLSSGNQIDDVASEIDTQLRAVYKGLLTDSCVLDDLTVEYVTAPDFPEGQAVIAIAEPGLRSQPDQDLSTGLCAVISLKTGVPHRYAQGRSFLPPGIVNSSAGNLGTWAASDDYWLAVLNWAQLSNFNWSSGDRDYALCVASMKRLALVQDPWYFPVTAIQHRNVQHFLRSRAETGP